MNEPLSKRIALGVEYDGSRFAGWQAQQHRQSVQVCLEEALSRIANHPVQVHCAGRTDAGVHGLGQVVHFDSHVPRAVDSWLLGANSYLPSDIRVIWSREVGMDFHARFSALARCYRYVILNRPMRSALLRSQATWVYAPLDERRMHQAAQALMGEQDFSSFRAHSCQSASPRRLMHFIDVYRRDERVFIDLCANAFVHHMVRNIAGVLIEIGTGRKPVEWTAHLLECRDRTQAAMTASPNGLHLLGVLYPKNSGLPCHPIFERLPANVSRYQESTSSSS
jgi:tRNA pseudouridine38-40 synthase